MLIGRFSSRDDGKKVGDHIEEMGLSGAVAEVDSLGIARFDPTSMVAWREKQTLGLMKSEAFERAKVNYHCVRSPLAIR